MFTPEIKRDLINFFFYFITGDYVDNNHTLKNTIYLLATRVDYRVV